MSKFKFANGREVELSRVSPLTWRDFERSVPKPKPPTQKTELGVEANYSHPDYIDALNDYQIALSDKRFDSFILFGVDCEIDEEAVAAFRARAKRANLSLPADDLLVYVKYICITCSEDILRMQKELIAVSIPTEEKISEAADEFKSNLEGTTNP